MDDTRRLKRNAYMRAWKRANKDRVNRTNQKWKDANRNLVRTRERRRAFLRAGTGEGYRALWLNNIKHRAKKKGLPFNLTLEDLPFPAVCPILGIPLIVRSGSFHDNSPSIDRLVPERGYVKGNVAIVSYRANRIKDYGTLDELRKVVAYLERMLDMPTDGNSLGTKPNYSEAEIARRRASGYTPATENKHAKSGGNASGAQGSHPVKKHTSLPKSGTRTPKFPP